jgi:hypothetical protein
MTTSTASSPAPQVAPRAPHRPHLQILSYLPSAAQQAAEVEAAWRARHPSALVARVSAQAPSGCDHRQALRADLEQRLDALAREPDPTGAQEVLLLNASGEDITLLAHALTPLSARARLSWTTLLGPSCPAPSEDPHLAGLIELSSGVLICGATPPLATRYALRGLNPSARVRCVLAAEAWEPHADDPSPDLSPPALAQRAGWLQAIEGGLPPDAPCWHVFRAWRPLDPSRWLAFAQRPWPELLRARGFLWMAPRMDRAALCAFVGAHRVMTPAGRWWANLTPDQWPQDPALHLRILARWQEPFGDRRQEWAFLLTEGADPAPILEGLRACLLSDEYFTAGQLAWRYLSDPTPDLRWSSQPAVNPK